MQSRYSGTEFKDSTVVNRSVHTDEINNLDSIFEEIIKKLSNSVREEDKIAILAYKKALQLEQNYLCDKNDHDKRAANALLAYVNYSSVQNLEKFKLEANNSGFNPRTRQAAWAALGVIIGVVVGLTIAAVIFLSSGAEAAAGLVGGFLMPAGASGFLSSGLAAAFASVEAEYRFNPVLDAKRSGQELLKLSIFNTRTTETETETEKEATKSFLSD